MIHCRVEEQEDGTWDTNVIIDGKIVRFKDPNISFCTEKMINFLRDNGIKPFTEPVWHSPVFYNHG